MDPDMEEDDMTLPSPACGLLLPQPICIESLLRGAREGHGGLRQILEELQKKINRRSEI